VVDEREDPPSLSPSGWRLLVDEEIESQPDGEILGRLTSLAHLLHFHHSLPHGLSLSFFLRVAGDDGDGWTVTNLCHRSMKGKGKVSGETKGVTSPCSG